MNKKLQLSTHWHIHAFTNSPINFYIYQFPLHLYCLQTPIFQQGADLFSFFCEALQDNGHKLEEKSVIIIASKLVALAQNRVVRATKKDIETWIQQESQSYWKTNVAGVFLSINNNILIANAGIDASNSKTGELILWPKNVQAFADELRTKIQNTFSLQQIGVLISDSRCTPLRTGVSGVALAWSGFVGVRDERGKKDIFGNPLQVTKSAIADNLASASELLMGNANERTPFLVCTSASIEFTSAQQHPDMATFPPQEDIFAPLWNEKLFSSPPLQK